MTVRDTILRLTKELIENGGYVSSQSLVGPGALQNTFPREYTNDTPGVLDLPVQDSSNNGICVGYALAGKRVCHVIRFAPFGLLNLWTTLNYASKSKEMWGVKCPIMVRAISVDSGQIGPVASNSQTFLPMHFPGIDVFAPVLPEEFESVYKHWETSENPVYLSEHRSTYNLTDDFPSSPCWLSDSQATIYAIGSSRIAAIEAKERLFREYKIKCSVIGVWKLKPLILLVPANSKIFSSSKFSLVVDTDHVTCGLSEHIACKLMLETGKPAYPLGLAERTTGFSKAKDNLPPTASQIVDFVLEKLGRKS